MQAKLKCFECLRLSREGSKVHMKRAKKRRKMNVNFIKKREEKNGTIRMSTEMLITPTLLCAAVYLTPSVALRPVARNPDRVNARDEPRPSYALWLEPSEVKTVAVKQRKQSISITKVKKSKK